MMKNLLHIILLFLFGCTKQVNDEVILSKSKSTVIAESVSGPDLKPLPLSFEYDGFANGIGILKGYRIERVMVTQSMANMFGFPLGETIRVLSYDCPIENIAQQGRANDFYFDISETGVQEGSYTNIKNLLDLSLFKDNLPVFPEIKQSFYLQTTSVKIGYDWSKHWYYEWDTSFIHAQGLDRYRNMVRVPEGDATYLLVINVNPDKAFFETDYSNNIITIAIKVIDGIPYLDQSLTGQAIAASNFTGTLTGKGKNRYVYLNWECPYHEPIYVKHWFTIKKNGVVIADNIDVSEYKDYVQGNFKQAMYEVTINVPGLQPSLSNSIIVKK